MKVYAFVPAKGTSERIENKNMRYLDGTPLYVRALETLLKCQEIDHVFLDTESEEMFERINYLPITFMKRDKKLATNQTDGHQMFLNEINSYPDADIYVQFLCTSPFIEPETIDNAIRQLKNGNNDSAILMKKDKLYLWDSNNNPLYDKNHIPNSKDLPDTFIESMGLYMCKKETALQEKKRYGNNPLFIFGKPHELIDVNNNEDLVFANIYAKGIKHNDNEKLNLIKHFITSSALSDLIDDMNIEKNTICGGVINGFMSNMQTVLFGRANTLKLRKLKEDESFEGIYKALDSYNGISENDIIIIENDIPDYAYFGDLNARLAIRKGASGVVINGATRDKEKTKSLLFPVFCKTYNSQDVRRRATVDYINKPIHIDNVKIHPKDLIFVDEGAVVVIYQQYEQELIERVLRTFNTENKIINDIISGNNTNDIISKYGAF